MPEYLAPGVYVEEVSFRSKSIEGVGTSTTGFAGPTRTGPIGETPELITSFNDFERVYGGLDDLSFGINYIAHAVRAYFNEGGARLYVSRVYAGDPAATAAVEVAASADATPKKARFVARFPGSAGNGQLTLRLEGTPVTLRAMNAAPSGTLLRTGTSGTPAKPALLTSTLGTPFSLPDGGKLLLTLGAEDKEITFKGEAARVESDDALPDPLVLAADQRMLSVTIDGVQQAITLPEGSQARAAAVDMINSQIRGGFARLTAANHLEIGSDRRGSKASVSVGQNAALKFAAPKSDTNSADANNNVENLQNVSVQEINALLGAQGANVRLVLLPNGQVLLSTTATGTDAKLAVRNAAGSVEGALGFAATAAPIVGTAGATITYYVKSGNQWKDSGGNALALAGLKDDQAPAGGAEIVTLGLTAADADGNVTSFDGLALDAAHPRYIGNLLAAKPARRADALYNRYAFVNEGVDAFRIVSTLFSGSDVATLTASGGGDGLSPQPSDYEAALALFESVEDISIVAAPGATAYGDATNAHAYANAVTSHAETRRLYRIAVLDTPPDETLVSGAREFRGKLIDSTRGALYFPWVVVANPLYRTGAENIPREINLPPSGFVCGIYARNDITRGVYKAPANEPVRGALRFAVDINVAQQEVLNPIGVNCLRYLSGRGYRVWGARTVSSDPEWKYVNVRRYFNYLEASIDRGTQWAVFEPNGERLWANIRSTIEAFLYNEWVSGALLGSSPQEAFFVRCDRSTMTQNDLDNGRLICLIGVAALKPAEFVIFRIGQKTADARS